MSTTPSDLTQHGEALIYAMINTANPSPTNGAASGTNTTIGAPTALTSDPSGKNTSVVLTAISGQGYTGTETFYYDRLDIQTQVMAVKAPSGATLVNKLTYNTIADILVDLNAAYGLDILAADLSNSTASAVVNTYPGSLTLDIAATCLTYTGTLTVAITDPAIAVASVLSTTVMTGLIAPPPPF